MMEELGSNVEDLRSGVGGTNVVEIEALWTSMESSLDLVHSSSVGLTSILENQLVDFPSIEVDDGVPGMDLTSPPKAGTEGALEDILDLGADDSVLADDERGAGHGSAGTARPSAVAQVTNEALAGGQGGGIAGSSDVLCFATAPVSEHLDVVGVGGEQVVDGGVGDTAMLIPTITGSSSLHILSFSIIDNDGDRLVREEVRVLPTAGDQPELQHLAISWPTLLAKGDLPG
ncbi:hypothetical protein Dimus_005585 [Dionaea muscipula]